MHELQHDRAVRHRPGGRIPVMLIAIVGAIALTATPALAAVDQIDSAAADGVSLEHVSSGSEDNTDGGSGSKGSSEAGNEETVSVTSQQRSPDVGAAQTGSPNASAQSQGSVVEVSVLGEEIVAVSRTRSAAGEGSSSEATLVSLLGNEIIGAGSSAANGSESDETGLLMEICEESGGQICLALLFGHASSSDDATSSEARANTAVVSACIGGQQEHPLEDCDGPVDAGVAESSSRSSVNKTEGSSEATHSTSLARVCLGGYGDDDVCDGLGLRLFTSSSRSQASPGQPGAADADAALVTLEAGGDEIVRLTQSQEIALPPGCPEQSAACIWLNISDTDAVAGAAAAEASAVELSLLPPADLLDASVSSGGSGANAAGVEVLGEMIRPEPGPPARPTVEPLAITGNGMLTLLALGLFLVVTGSSVVRRGRSASTSTEVG